MVQKFLPKIEEGDKRVFVIGGVIKGAIRRIPVRGSIISNIGQGGMPTKTSLTKQELKIAKIVATDLKKNQIVFAGIDLISGYLTGDINITSPTGLKNYKDLTGINLAVDFWATGAIVDIAKQANKKILIQINRANQRSKLISKTNDFIKSLKLSSTKTIIGHRQIYAASMGEGKTAVEKQKKSKAVEEIRKLSEQILMELK